MVGRVLRRSQRACLGFVDHFVDRGLFDCVDGLTSSCLFGFLFGTACACTKYIAADANRGGEHSGMVGPGCHNVVARGGIECRHSEFLKPGLVVKSARAVADCCRNVIVPQAKDEAPGSFDTTVDVDRTNDGLECVGKDRLFVATTGRSFTLTKQQRWAKIDFTGDLSECDCVYDARPQLRKLALGQLGIFVENLFGNRKSKDGIAEELKPLVGLDLTVLGTPRTM